MKKLLRLLFRLFLFVSFAIVGTVVVETAGVSSKQANISTITPVNIPDGAEERLSKAIQFKTISNPDVFNKRAFLAQDSFIFTEYTLVDSFLEKIEITPYSLVYKWAGKKPDLTPILLMGHLDVVPVEKESLSKWTEDPFSGLIKEGFIWGRGTLDDKLSVFGTLEAIEQLLSEGYSPNRTVYLAFGHDEEIGGVDGAQKIAAWFKNKNIQFEYILDEGQLVIEKAMSGIERPVALIGLAEKGYVTLTLTARLEHGGHSSMPPKETAIGVLSQAIVDLQDHPFSGKINGAVAQFLAHTAPEMSWPYKAFLSNLWLTEGLLVRQMSADVSTSAMVRTTISPTIINGGIKDNVLPSFASAKINFRILPGETQASVAEYVRKTINDSRVEISIDDGGNEPSAVSEINSFGYQVIQKSIQEVFPDVIVAPSLVIAATDSRHYSEVANNTYRFMPVQLQKSDLPRIHGMNERVSVENYRQAIRFYRQLVVNSGR